MQEAERCTTAASAAMTGRRCPRALTSPCTPSDSCRIRTAYEGLKVPVTMTVSLGRTGVEYHEIGMDMARLTWVPCGWG